MRVPSCSPSRNDMRCAAARTARRRGCSMTIFLPCRKPGAASITARGKPVLLPAPGGACTLGNTCALSAVKKLWHACLTSTRVADDPRRRRGRTLQSVSGCTEHQEHRSDVAAHLQEGSRLGGEVVKSLHGNPCPVMPHARDNGFSRHASLPKTCARAIQQRESSKPSHRVVTHRVGCCMTGSLALAQHG